LEGGLETLPGCFDKDLRKPDRQPRLVTEESRLGVKRGVAWFEGNHDFNDPL